MNRVTDPRSVDWASAYRYLEAQQESILLRLADRMEKLEQNLKQLEVGRITDVSVEVDGDNVIRSVVSADGRALEYGFYIYRDGGRVWTQRYSRSNTLVWVCPGPGEYEVRAFIRSSGADEPGDQRIGGTVTVPHTGVRSTHGSDA